MTSFDFDVISDTPREPLPNVQKPPAEKKDGESPALVAAPKADPGQERGRAA
jgi:hypothetical protein